jgi:hypothetical protein
MTARTANFALVAGDGADRHDHAVAARLEDGEEGTGHADGPEHVATG